MGFATTITDQGRCTCEQHFEGGPTMAFIAWRANEWTAELRDAQGRLAHISTPSLFIESRLECSCCDDKRALIFKFYIYTSIVALIQLHSFDKPQHGCKSTRACSSRSSPSRHFEGSDVIPELPTQPKNASRTPGMLFVQQLTPKAKLSCLSL